MAKGLYIKVLVVLCVHVWTDCPFVKDVACFSQQFYLIILQLHQIALNVKKEDRLYAPTLCTTHTYM